MKKYTQKALVLTAMAILLTSGMAIGQQLTDVVVFGADGSGSWFGQPDIWETRPGANNNNNWIWTGSTFLNGPSDPDVQPNIALSLGTQSFTIFGAPGVPNPRFGISLFFDGSSVPSISAFGPVLTNALQSHVFFADGALNTPATLPGANTGYLFPGAGTLSFTSGNKLITLSDFYWANPSTFGLDMVGQTQTGADGQLDYVGGITLTVTTIPEPQVITLTLACLFGHLLGTRRLNKLS